MTQQLKRLWPRLLKNLKTHKKSPYIKNKNSIWNNDNFILLYLGNFNWMGKAGHRCQCSASPISSKAIHQCNILNNVNPFWKKHAQETAKYLSITFGEQDVNLTESWTAALNAFVIYARDLLPLNSANPKPTNNQNNTKGPIRRYSNQYA